MRNPSLPHRHDSTPKVTKDRDSNFHLLGIPVVVFEYSWTVTPSGEPTGFSFTLMVYCFQEESSNNPTSVERPYIPCRGQHIEPKEQMCPLFCDGEFVQNKTKRKSKKRRSISCCSDRRRPSTSCYIRRLKVGKSQEISRIGIINPRREKVIKERILETG